MTTSGSFPAGGSRGARVDPFPEQLEGDGVVLRRWRPSDAELLHRAVVESTDHLRPWMAWIADEPLTVDQRRELLERWEREWAAGGDVNFAILVDGQVAGGCGLHRRRGPNALEIGYWTHTEFLRRGIARRTANLLTGAAFTVPGIERVEIRHDKANEASAGIPRGLRYRLVAEHPHTPTAPGEDGIECTWCVTRDEWLNRAC